MKKLFISADIEGTCGIIHWHETEKNHADWAYFREQMTREVAAACQGALSAGYDEVLVKDAHDSARNIDPRGLPVQTRLYRGWGGHPYCMMQGLDESFAGVVFTGYHNAAGTDSNPLAHTMSTAVVQFVLNGELASELYINALIASMLGVPVYAVSGDAGLCEWMRQKNPHTAVVPVNTGYGPAVLSLHPDEAVQQIRAAVTKAVAQPKKRCLFPMPEGFECEITFREHGKAMRGSFYPGIERKDARTLRFVCEDYFEFLRMMHFVV